MSLEALANVADILSAILVIGGLIFGLLQFAQFRQQRQERAALELARSFQNAEFANALRLVLSLPEGGVGGERLMQLGPEYGSAAMLVSLTLESVGIMVQRRVIALDMVWDLMGGVVLESWERLHRWTEEIRRDQDREKFNEWLEWLADRLKGYEGRTRSEPAFRRFQDWKA
jgi:hypothetical protein